MAVYEWKTYYSDDTDSWEPEESFVDVDSKGKKTKNAVWQKFEKTYPRSLKLINLASVKSENILLDLDKNFIKKENQKKFPKKVGLMKVNQRYLKRNQRLRINRNQRRRENKLRLVFAKKDQKKKSNEKYCLWPRATAQLKRSS